MTVYLDCNATTPIEPDVLAIVMHYLKDEYGNASSRTHEYGQKAKKAVETARIQITELAAATPDEVIFTSGATESNNLAILGLREYAEEVGCKHIISTQIEHKTILEPLQYLEKQGFTVEYLAPERDGTIKPATLEAALRTDTLLVSIMHVNNETGVIQPIDAFTHVLKNHSAFFHIDAAQGFGKLIKPLQDPRIDMLTISGHKLYAPKGIGALIARKRGFHRIPLKPLMFGGNQERGLRPGTLPVPLIAGLGLAAKMGLEKNTLRNNYCQQIRNEATTTLASLNPIYHGSSESIAHVLNFSIPGINSEAAMVALKGIAAVSNGSACTSQSYTPSHVLKAMKLSDTEISGAIRVSWSHLTDPIDWVTIRDALQSLR